MSDFFKVDNLSFAYDKSKRILSDINFTLEQGQVTGLIGLNGCGKSTLLKCILNQLNYSGSIQLEGINLKTAKTKQLARLIGYIPQGDGIDINISVMDVVLMGFYDAVPLFASPNKNQRQQAIKAIDSVGLNGFYERDYLSLSGGEKQLCLLARTLLRNCPLLILDEPDSSLDAKNKHSVLNTLKLSAKVQNSSLLLALHDLTFALNYCDKIILLSDGKIKAIFSPHEITPKKIQLILQEVYGKIQVDEIGDEIKHLVAVIEDN
jgi:iron complex transport system ATP-binding protein